MFAVRHLPHFACPSVCLFTDGAAELPETCNYDNVFMRLNRQDVNVHLIHIGRESLEAYAHLGWNFQHLPSTSFGYVPDMDLARFISESTGGILVDAPPPFKGITKPRFDFKTAQLRVDSPWKVLQDAILYRGQGYV